MAQRETPRFSVNKIGEYMTAEPVRRRQLIRQQKRPSAVIVPRYEAARRAIIECLATSDAALLEARLESLRGRASEPTFSGRMAEDCLEAVERFRAIWPGLTQGSTTFVAGAHSAPALTMSGVAISVRPDLHVRWRRRERESVGMIKLYLSKSHPLTPASASYVTAISAHYIDAQGAGDVDPRLVQVVDVFTGQVFIAGSYHKRRLADVEAACEEIAGRWAGV